MQSGSSPISTTVCDLVRNPAKYSGERVRFHANVSSDGFEYSSLFDPNCDTVGLSFGFFSEDWDKDAKLKKFDKALEQMSRAKQPTISATFTGRFTYSPNNTNVTKRRMFEITEVDDLHLKR